MFFHNKSENQHAAKRRLKLILSSFYGFKVLFQNCSFLDVVAWPIENTIAILRRRSLRTFFGYYTAVVIGPSSGFVIQCFDERIEQNRLNEILIERMEGLLFLRYADMLYCAGLDL